MYPLEKHHEIVERMGEKNTFTKMERNWGMSWETWEVEGCVYGEGTYYDVFSDEDWV